MEKTMSFQLPADLYTALGKIAAKDHRSKAYIVRHALEQFIEDYIDVQKAEKVLKDIEEGRSHTISWEEVQKECGLLD